MERNHCASIATQIEGGCVMRLKFCAACGETKDLQSHHLVTRAEGGTNSEKNLLGEHNPTKRP
jgi:5-methylcytosine-specific restriction endonuclease McrA